MEAENRENKNLNLQISNYQIECQQLRDLIEEELDQKSELQRQLVKTQAETQQWRQRYENEELRKLEEFDEMKNRERVTFFLIENFWNSFYIGLFLFRCIFLIQF